MVDRADNTTTDTTTGAAPPAGRDTSTAAPATAPAPRSDAIAQDIFCQDCGYNLRGLTSDRCPECGGSLDTIRAAASGIPWVYRHEIGRFRAYWKTVYLVMFRQGRFCDEMARPVDFDDCQRFRWVTILHVYIPILLATIATYFFAPRRPFDDLLLDAAYWQVWPMAVMHACVLLFLAAGTGVPSYFFHPTSIPTRLQNRAIALSYYACGALAVTALPIAAWAVGLALGDSMLGMGLILFGVLAPLGQAIAWWLDLVHLMRRLLPQHGRRRLAVGLGVPVLWVASFFLILLGPPAAVWFVAVIAATLA